MTPTLLQHVGQAGGGKLEVCLFVDSLAVRGLVQASNTLERAMNPKTHISRLRDQAGLNKAHSDYCV